MTGTWFLLKPRHLQLCTIHPVHKTSTPGQQQKISFADLSKRGLFVRKGTQKTSLPFLLSRRSINIHNSLLDTGQISFQLLERSSLVIIPSCLERNFLRWYERWNLHEKVTIPVNSLNQMSNLYTKPVHITHVMLYYKHVAFPHDFPAFKKKYCLLCVKHLEIMIILLISTLKCTTGQSRIQLYHLFPVSGTN